MTRRLRVLVIAAVTAAFLATPTGASAAAGGEEGEAEITAVKAYAERQAPDAFAGVYFDADGVLHAGFVTRSDEHLRALRERSSAPDRLARSRPATRRGSWIGWSSASAAT